MASVNVIIFEEFQVVRLGDVLRIVWIPFNTTITDVHYKET